MGDFINTINIYVPTILSVCLTFYFARLDKKWDKRAEAEEKKQTWVNAQNEGLTALLRERLLLQIKSATQKGWEDPEKKDEVRHMYNAYHNLGGNDMITSLYQQYLKLPPIKKEVEREN